MRAVRFLSFALLLVAGLAGTASAQTYDNTPGVYTDVKVGIVPAALPPGSLPGDLPSLGPDLYTGTLTIILNSDGTYFAQYKGDRGDGARLNASATFNSSWLGVKMDFLVVGGTREFVIFGIDGKDLIQANINGVGTVDGANQRVIAKFRGTGFYPPELTQFKVNPAPGFLR